MNDVSLYAESKLTRRQAICEITNVVLRSNIKPRVVRSILELLQKLLPSDNTLPITIDDLFSAIISCKYSTKQISVHVSSISSRKQLACNTVLSSTQTFAFDLNDQR